MHLPPDLSSRGRKMSPPDALKAPQVQVEAPWLDVIPEGFEGGLYDLSLRPLYLDHVA